MKPRKVDLAFEWMSAQPRRSHHYRDEVWPAHAKLYPDEFAESKSRNTPWGSLHRDMSEDERFVRGEKPCRVRLALFPSAIRGGKE